MSEQNDEEGSKKRKYTLNMEAIPEKKKKVKPLSTNNTQEPGTPKVFF
jgi:hypothetical protein